MIFRYYPYAMARHTESEDSADIEDSASVGVNEPIMTCKIFSNELIINTIHFTFARTRV